MKIVWVTNNKYYSKLLRYIFNEPTSHVGSIFTFNGFSLVVDLNRPCGSVYDTRYWLSKYNVIWEMELDLPKEEEIYLYKSVRNYAVLRPYDMNGYYFGMFVGLFNLLFGMKYPSRNYLASKDKSMCQEILTPIIQNHVFKKYIPHDIDPIILTEKTPHMSMMLVKAITKNNPKVRWHYNG